LVADRFQRGKAPVTRINSARALGEILRGRRHELGRTQAEVASAAGVSRPWLAQVEAGKQTASVGLVLRVLDALALDLDATVRGQGRPPSQPAVAAVDLDALLDDLRRP
jgi:transcriptional regulator with XRE-family HTH domain